MLTSPPIKQEYDLAPADVDTSPGEENPETGLLDAWVILLGLAACVLVLLVLERYIGVYLPDDAYITFRYAENLASGQGLVFNSAAPPVEGYSNLLWILLLALLAKFGLSVPVWASNIGALLSVVNLVLLYALSVRITGSRGRSLLPPALLALTAPYALWARGGLETMLFTALLLLSILLTLIALDGLAWAYPAAAVSLFLLALTRHDGVIPLVLSGLFVLTQVVKPSLGRRNTGPTDPAGQSRNTGQIAALVSWAALLIAYAAYTLWRSRYFGQLVPAPFFSRLGGTITDPGEIAVALGSYFTRGPSYSAYGDLLVPAFALAAAGYAWLRRSRPGLPDWYIPSCVISLSLLYFASGSYNPGIRYMVPVIPLLYVYAQEPIARLLRSAWRGNLENPAKREHRANMWLPVVGIALSITIFLLFMAPRTRYDGQHAEVAKLTSLAPLGVWLGKYAPPTSTIALQDIGVVAYYSHLKVIDNNPGALTNGDIIYTRGARGFADITLDSRPEFLVFTSVSDRVPVFNSVFEPLKADSRFTQGYVLYNKLKYWEDRGYWVYVRADIHLPPDAADSFPQTEWKEFPDKGVK